MKRVLIVDDHADNRDLLRTLLHGHGFVVDEARHGAEALSLAMRRRPTLVVSDLLMPEMDGYTLLRQWKADPVLRHVPFIVYTATYTDPRDEQLAIDLGADAFLIKPAEPEVFLQTLQQVLEAADRGALEPPRLPTGDPVQIRAAYDDTLGRKLEAKAAQLDQTRSALRDSESRYSSLIDNSLDMILLGTPDGQILAANHATCQALGMTEAQICQAGRAGLIVHDENFASMREKRAAAGQATGEVTVIRGDGSRFVAEATTSQYRDEQGALRVSVIMRDLTEKKRAQAQREAIDAQLHDAQKLQALGTLTGGIAHDFNNIVGAILGNVGLARQGFAADQPVAEYLEQIDVAAKRARHLVQQLLQYSKPTPTTSLTLLLQPLVGETLGLLRATVPASVTLDARVAAAPLSVRGDPTQLQQVLLNLGTNAWHALAGHPGLVQVGLDAVEFAADDRQRPLDLAPGPYAHLWVSDNGCGMDAATLARIFDPFFTTKPEGQGTGLGLAAVQGIVNAHGGAITVESQVGQGSLFSLYFPLVGQAEPAPQDATATAFGAIDGDDRLVMYVDDDQTMALLAERLLQRAGYRTATFLDATSALSAVRERPQDFAAVVTDYNMPHLTGLDLAREIAAIRRDLPVIISSGHIDAKLRAHAGQHGVTQLLHKERLLEDLVRQVQDALAAAPLA